jgi:hypothetical protein
MGLVTGADNVTFGVHTLDNATQFNDDIKQRGIEWAGNVTHVEI